MYAEAKYLDFSFHFQLLGYFGGIHLALLAAYVCQRHANASLNVLISIFFETFLHWHWPMPVMLQDLSMPFKYPDSRLLMPIMMPSRPFEYCNSNITGSTFRRIMEEFQRGFNMTKVDLYFFHMQNNAIYMDVAVKTSDRFLVLDQMHLNSLKIMLYIFSKYKIRSIVILFFQYLRFIPSLHLFLLRSSIYFIFYACSCICHYTFIHDYCFDHYSCKD